MGIFRFLFCFILFVFQTTFCFTKKVNDSKILSTWHDVNKSPEKRLESLYLYLTKNIELGDKTYLRTQLKTYENFCKKHKIEIHIGHFFYLNGILLFREGEIESSISNLKKSVVVYRKLGEKENLTRVLSELGASLTRGENYLEALEVLREALAINQGVGSIDIEIDIIFNLACMFSEIEDFDESNNYLSKGLNICRKNSKIRMIAVISNLLGANAFVVGDLVGSKQFYTVSYENSVRVGHFPGIAHGLERIARIEEKWGNLSQAKKMYNESFLYFEKFSSELGFCRVTSGLGRVSLLEGHILVAEAKLSEALKLAIKLNSHNDMKTISYSLYQLYKKQGKVKLALKMYEQYVGNNNDGIKNKIIRIQYQMNREYEKKIENLKYKKEKQLINEEKRIATINLRLILTALFATIIVGVVMVSRFIAVRKQKRKIVQQKQITDRAFNDLTDSINYTKNIQNVIFPSLDILNESYRDFFLFYQPKDVISGDFYWYKKINNKKYFAVADCTGHGVPGAMVSLVCSNALNKVLQENEVLGPAEILNLCREIIINFFSRNDSNIHDGMDISLCMIECGVLTFAGANCSTWIARDNEKAKLVKDSSLMKIKGEKHTVFELKGCRMPVGFYLKQKEFLEVQFLLEENDIIYMSSDGFFDQFGGEKGKKYKRTAFRNLLLNVSHEPFEDQQGLISSEFYNWQGELDQIDDVCVCAIKV